MKMWIDECTPLSTSHAFNSLYLISWANARQICDGFSWKNFNTRIPLWLAVIQSSELFQVFYSLKPRQKWPFCKHEQMLFLECKCFFLLKNCHRSFFLRVRLTIFQHWFQHWIRLWLGNQSLVVHQSFCIMFPTSNTIFKRSNEILAFLALSIRSVCTKYHLTSHMISYIECQQWDRLFLKNPIVATWLT